MRIAQIAPLFESVPPRLYGGTERVVHYLTEELVRQGHEVTLFASGDSITSAELVACTPRALRLDPDVRDAVPHQMLLLDKVRQRAEDFDILHFHVDYLHFPLFRTQAGRTLTTLHGRQDLCRPHAVLRSFPGDAAGLHLGCAARAAAAGQFCGDRPPWAAARSAPADVRTARRLSRISRAHLPGERPDRAIAIARASGLPLKIAAKVDKADERYFHEAIAPLLEGDGVEFIGEINESEKTEFLGNAVGLLFPIDWPEPFGLVMIEAMACGTPVLAFRSGSVAEIVEDGVSGRIVTSVEHAAQAIPTLLALDRRAVRAQFEEHFSATRMAADYVRVYQKLLRKRPAAERELSVLAAHSAAMNGHTGHAAAAIATQHETN